MESGFLSTNVELSCKKEGDEKKRKTGEKGNNGGRSRGAHVACPAALPPPPSPTYQVRWKRYSRKFPLSPPPQLVQFPESAEDFRDSLWMEVKSKKTDIRQ